MSYLKCVKKVNLSYHLLQFFVDEVIALACNFCLNRLQISSQFAQNRTRIMRFFLFYFKLYLIPYLKVQCSTHGKFGKGVILGKQPDTFVKMIV